MRPALLCLAILLPQLGACPPSAPRNEAELVEIHARVLQAHRDRDPEAWTALEADTVTVGSRGRLFLASRAERLERRRRYLGSTRFSVYRDLQPPLVQVSEDGTLGWLYANVEVVAYPDTAGATDSSHTIWSWIELYQRRDGRWLMVGNVSDDRPGPLE